MDSLRFNTRLISVELTGNEIPEDISRAIGKYLVFTNINNFSDLALERNRNTHRNNLDSNERAQFLSSTLQQLSNEHNQTIGNLQSKLALTETELKTMSKKLDIASAEMENNHLGFKKIEVQLIQQKALREKYKID